MVNELLGFSVELEALQSLRTLWGLDYFRNFYGGRVG